MNNKQTYLDPESSEGYYAVKDLVAFIGKLCNNYNLLYRSFLCDFEAEFSDEYAECGDCGEIGVYNCSCEVDGADYDIYNDEADF